MKAVEPGLEFVEDQGRVLLAEQVLQERLRGNGRPDLLKLARDSTGLWDAGRRSRPKGMRYSQFDIVSEIGRKPRCNVEPVQASRLDAAAPAGGPGFNGHRVQKGMVQQGHDVRLAAATLTDEDHGPPAAEVDTASKRPLHVGRWIRDLQQFRRVGPLRPARVLLVAQLDRGGPRCTSSGTRL